MARGHDGVRFLFVHQNFPGQFLHIVRHLVASKHHEIVFITEPNENFIDGVRKVPYAKPPPPATEAHIAARELDGGVRRAEAVGRTAANLKHLGFEPDIIIGHHGWGEMLNLRDVWPKVPLLGYMEFYYQPVGIDVGFDPEFPVGVDDFPRIRAKNAINHIALNLGGEGQSPTEWQLSTYPAWARQQINLVWEGVDLDVCQADPKVRRAPLTIGGMTIKPTDKLVTYVSRDLEPYRGFPLMMRAIPHLLKARKDIKIVMVGGDGVSYGNGPAAGGNWREVMSREIGNGLDPARVVFPGRVPYATYLSLLQRSDAHVYLTYPFVASWSLREAFAIGCAIVGSDSPPVREFITHGKNGLLTSFFDPRGLAHSVMRLLEDTALNHKLRVNARRYAEARLSMADYMASYETLIERMTGMRLSPAVPSRVAARTRAKR
jgi:glycosyltransferase involved in cell wall biosynthesis